LIEQTSNAIHSQRASPERPHPAQPLTRLHHVTKEAIAGNTHKVAQQRHELLLLLPLMLPLLLLAPAGMSCASLCSSLLLLLLAGAGRISCSYATCCC
jgi:hypothetical protein